MRGLLDGLAHTMAAMDNPLFINTILLGGGTAGKIAAAGALHLAGVGLTDFQVLLDFDGALGDRRTEKRAEAIAILDMAVYTAFRPWLCRRSLAACDA